MAVTNPEARGATDADLIHLFREMARIRAFELAVAEAYRNAEIPGFVHLSIGQEASAVGVCAALEAADRITTTHRGHAHLLARGVPADRLMAELFGKATGVCGGYGGSMHSMSVEHGVLGANGIVGAGLPIAVGSAFEQRHRTKEGVTVAFFGEGALSTGSAHEAFIVAASLSVPVLFVCEFNGWVEFTPYSSLMPFRSLTTWAEQYGITAMDVPDGDVRTVRSGARTLLREVRAGRPGFLVVPTSRIRGHYEGDAQPYRDDLPADASIPRDPLLQLREYLSQEEADRLDAQAADEVARAFEETLAAPRPDSGIIFKDVWA